tara:strand:- start:279 stop:473 length:195 start_codon:yes stop_codon:yes gene_type:complete
VQLAQPDHKELLERKDHKETPAHKVQQAHKALLEILVLLAHRVPPGLKGLQGLKGQPDLGYPML